MAEDTYPYPEDEFDDLGRQRTPQGVHRAPRPWWRVWGPLIAVVILAPLVAFGLVRLAAGGSDDPGGATTPTAAEVTPGDGAEGGETTGEEGAEPTDEPAEGETEPAPEETEAEPEPAPVDRAAAVSVLNGAGVQGLAGRVQERLEGTGWSAVSAGNYQSAEPSVSTVFYRDAGLLPAAEAVAAELGIGPVVELADVASVTVVLRSDFSE